MKYVASVVAAVTAYIATTSTTTTSGLLGSLGNFTLNIERSGDFRQIHKLSLTSFEN